MNQVGKNVWVFPDLEMPPAGDFELKGHESIIILNMNDTPAHVKYVYQEAILSKADYERYKWAKEIAAEVVAALKGA